MAQATTAFNLTSKSIGKVVSKLLALVQDSFRQVVYCLIIEPHWVPFKSHNWYSKFLQQEQVKKLLATPSSEKIST